MNKLSKKAQNIALEIWKEQLDFGIGDPGEVASLAHIEDWLGNRTYPQSLLEDAAKGDAAAVVKIRTEAGLPIFR